LAHALHPRHAQPSDSCRVTTPDNLRSAHREAVLTGSWTEAPFAGLSAWAHPAGGTALLRSL